MRRFFSSVLLVFGLLACGPLPQEQDAESNVGITAPDGYAVACVSGYTRTQPHLCSDTTAISGLTTATLDNTCRNFDYTATTPILPLSVKWMDIQAAMVINSANAIGNRNVVMTFFWDASCVTSFGSLKFSSREEVAVAVTELMNTNFQARIPVVNQKIYYKGTTTGGAGSLFSLIPLGYYD